MHRHQHKNKTEAFLHILPLLVVGLAVSFTFASVAWAQSLSSPSVIDLINAEREKEGLNRLAENAALSRAADLKARDMIARDYFAHTSPDGLDPWHWLKEAEYRYQAAGENLAVNFTDPQAQHDAWMESATHRQNILNPRYEEIGVAVVAGKIADKETTVTVSLYGKPALVGGPSAAKKPAPEALPVAVQGAETGVLQLASQTNLAATRFLWLFQTSWIIAVGMLGLSLLSLPLAFLYKALESLRAFWRVSTRPPSAHSTP